MSRLLARALQASTPPSRPQRAALARIVEAYPPDHATQLGGLDAAQRTGDLLELYEGAARNAQALWGAMTDAVAGSRVESRESRVETK